MPPGSRPRPRHRPRPRPALIALLLAAALAAQTCDDARRSAPLADRVASAFCAHQLACCSQFELSMMQSGRYHTEADCLRFSTLATRQQLGTVEGAIVQGRITVDEARAEACLAAYRDGACNPLAADFIPAISASPDAAGMLAACPDALVGHVANGQACNLSAECLRGSRCLGAATTSTTSPDQPMPGTGGVPGTVVATPGVCLPYQRDGEPCNQSADCDETRSVCRTPAFVCGPKPQLGEPCSLQVDKFSGVVTSDCDDTNRLYCDDATTRVCRHYPRAGELCNQSTLPRCDPDPALALACNPFTGTCKGLSQEGDPCGAPAIPQCAGHLACHPTQSDGIGVCGPLPTQGEPCTDRCASPTVCAGSTCVLPGSTPLGAACAANADCASLSCSGFSDTNGQRVCDIPPYQFVRCVGADVTVGTFGGVGGIGGIGGAVGTGGREPPLTGAGGMGGGTSSGCTFGLPAIGDPTIADFDVDMTGTLILPIGGTFTYGGTPPMATAADGAWHVTLDANGTDADQYVGVGIYFNVEAMGALACIDASFHRGVAFEISGSIDGVGCTAQFAINDSAHTESTDDPRGTAPPDAWAPQAPLTVSSTPTLVEVPFAGPTAPIGGNPATPVDPKRLTGVLWQFSVPAGPKSSCQVNVVIDDVRFF